MSGFNKHCSGCGEVNSGHNVRTCGDQTNERVDVSRQRRWQLRKAAQGGCVICGKPAGTTTRKQKFCAEHREKRNEIQREWQRRNR